MSLAKDISSKSLPAPATATSSQLNIIPLPDVIKGDADWREYKSIQLANGVKCVFVNDKESKTTACSVCVGVGASSDPRELSGLAHFTEHM
jgi:secreted Zn-dependent insulinase-like peptidase